MRTYVNATLELTNISADKYEMVLEFLDDSDINYNEEEYAEYTIDERSESEKYDDWLWTLGDRQYEERRMEEIEKNEQ